MINSMKSRKKFITPEKAARLIPISISAGDAQTNDGWRNNKKPLRYYRLALINPF